MPPNNVIQWGRLSSSLLEKNRRIKEEGLIKSKRNCYRKFQYADLPSYKRLTSSGRENLASFERALSFLFSKKGGIKLGYMQKRLVDAVRIAFLRTMFGDDFVPNLDYLKKRYRIKEMYDVLAILFPRRGGKSMASQILAAAIAVSQPKGMWLFIAIYNLIIHIGNCTSYNLTGRQSRDWLSGSVKILEIFKKSPEFTWTAHRQDVREFIAIRTKYGTVYSIRSYPSAGSSDAKICCGQEHIHLLAHSLIHIHSFSIVFSFIFLFYKIKIICYI